MPTVLPIDSYSEEKVANKNWLNNKILYQTNITIDHISRGISFYDTGEIFDELDQLYMLEGTCYVPSIEAYEIFSDKTLNITMTYDKETKYLKIALNAYAETENNIIRFYYTKSEQKRLRISQNSEQNVDNYYPVMDVYVNGNTVLDTSKIAQIKSYKEVTQAEYNALPASKRTDGIMYCITDSAGSGVDTGVVDVQLNGVSIVDDNGYANITGLASSADLTNKQNLLVQGSNITLEPLVDGTVRISATGDDSGSDILDVTVNGTSVVSNNIAAIVQPTALSELANDTNFIDKTVNNLNNYYSKTATEDKIDEKLAAYPIVTSNGKGFMSSALFNKLNNTITDVTVGGTSVVDANHVATIDLSGKQNVLTAGAGITIDPTLDTISATSMTGATSSTNGVSGAVPQPYIGDRDKYLKGDGTWAEVAKSLSELTDVTVISPADGEALVYDNTNSIWINRTISNVSGISDLTDVQLTNLSDGESLVYDATNQKWINDTISGASAVSDLTDVQLTSLSDGQGLIYDATSQTWENGTLAYNVPIIYSAEEREVGVWVDGKPLYQKTITLSSAVSVPNNTWTTIYTDIFIGGIEQIVAGIHHNMGNGGAYYSCYYKPNGNNLQYDFVGNGTFNIASGTKFTLWYTKTADTPGSGTWTPDGEYAYHYSTSEQIIGTWIDGSTLYSIVYDNLNISVSTDYSNIHTGLYPANENVGIIIRCICIDTYGQCFFSNGIKFISNNNELGISIPSNGARTITKIILEYTKSSS